MMNSDPTQQQPPPGQEPYVEYGSAGDPNFYSNPQDPYSAPQGAYDPYSAPQTPYFYGAPQAAPLPLGEAIAQLPGQYWKVLTRPGPTTLAQEVGKARWDIIWVHLLGYALITAILSFLQNRLYPIVLPAQTTTSASGTTTTVDFRFLEGPLNFIEGPGAILVTLLSFFIFQGLYFGLAKAFRGTGTFPVQAYTFLLFQVPLGILGAALAFIPLLGGVVSLAAGVYEIVLSIFAIMAVHRVGGGKATGVILIPVGVLLLLACCALFFVVLSAVKTTPA